MMATSALSPHQNMHFLILFIFIFVVSACQPEANQSWTMNALDSLALWLKTTKNITRNWICLKMRDTSQLLAMLIGKTMMNHSIYGYCVTVLHFQTHRPHKEIILTQNGVPIK